MALDGNISHFWCLVVTGKGSGCQNQSHLCVCVRSDVTHGLSFIPELPLPVTHQLALKLLPATHVLSEIMRPDVRAPPYLSCQLRKSPCWISDEMQSNTDHFALRQIHVYSCELLPVLVKPCGGHCPHVLGCTVSCCLRCLNFH